MNAVEVVDVPEGASEDEARTLLNRPCQENRYMLVQVFLLPDGSTRAFYRLVARAYDNKPAERRTNRDGKADAAKAAILANPDKSIRELVRLLAGMGIQRSKSWVSEARMALRDGAND